MSLASDPLQQFAEWYAEAKDSEPLAHAMALSTVSTDGQPTSRMVLLKGHDEKALEFYTNYDSAKAEDMTHEPRVALLFHWSSLRRQVRFEGRAVRVSTAESEEYWKTRPRGSQLAAWASTQSAEIADKAVLEEAVEKYNQQFPDDVPLPPNWGGYRVKPQRVQFFISQQDRLHDRFLYARAAHGGWHMTRLSP